MKPDCPFCKGKTTLFGAKKGFNLFECGSCALMFVHPIPKNLADIYSKEYFKKDEAKTPHGYTDYDKDKEPMRRIFESYIGKCEGLVRGRKIFDVGAATGYVLDIAKSRGWETFGSELSEYAGGIASERGHKMTIGGLVGTELPNVDAVMMWDVLEHVDDPRAYIMAVNKMLSTGGILTISTPDRSSLWARVMGMKWQLIVPPEHLFYYSPKNLSKLLDECGFDVLEVGKPSKRFSLSYIFSQLGQWQGYAFWRVLARLTDTVFFRLFALPINLRDNMFIVAKKR